MEAKPDLQKVTAFQTSQSDIESYYHKVFEENQNPYFKDG